MTELPEGYDKLMFIRCKCGDEIQVPKDCEVERLICSKCLRMGCWEVLPF